MELEKNSAPRGRHTSLNTLYHPRPPVAQVCVEIGDDTRDTGLGFASPRVSFSKSMLTVCN